MLTLVIILIVLAALGILGVVIKGLLWLTAVAAITFVVALAYGWSRLKSSTAG